MADENSAFVPNVRPRPEPEFFSTLEADAAAAGRQLLVDCLVVNGDGKVFVQKRSADRRLYPNCWEVPGGHVEAGETVLQAVNREILEELQLKVTGITHYLGYYDWEVRPGWRKDDDNPQKRSLQLVVTAEGTVVTEAGKVSDYRWIGPGEQQILEENIAHDDPYVAELVARGFSIIGKP